MEARLTQQVDDVIGYHSETCSCCGSMHKCLLRLELCNIFTVLEHPQRQKERYICAQYFLIHLVREKQEMIALSTFNLFSLS